MTKVPKVLKFVGLCMAILTATLWLLWCYQRSMEPLVAADMASTFLQRRSLALQEFDGPTVLESPNIHRVFVWRSRERTPVLQIDETPVLQIDVSPQADYTCLYEVLEPHRVRQLECLGLE